MLIKLVLPNETLLDQEVDKITAPGTMGSFQVLPRHIDVAWSLKPGILILAKDTQEDYYAIHQGILVKEGATVYVASFQAIKGNSLEDLYQVLVESFRVQDDQEKKAREILVKLEADTIRRFMEIE
ncbi:F0F1 ATP synthase subunit epsilon [Acetobacterium sp.]|uniref:F0F1 ATP synthase subunit epsilon n=1 Tax=Acetobacterium sp. TaxID=1872094 RepID=UPI002728BAE1|nr:F0F1 ATP synthase subunit epsilon [Acetobacterium sp.]MDO9494027.1 F0F1 ATP synthase subunit epsilon [Acetobacterium sp.]